MIKDQPPYEAKEIGEAIELFIKHVDSIGNSMLLMIFGVQEIAKTTRRLLFEFEDKNCVVEDTPEHRRVSVTEEYHREWKRYRLRYEHFKHARVLMPRSMLVTMVSQFDAFLGRLLRIIFTRRPEAISSSEKKISYEQLADFDSVSAIREYIVGKEIESILRSSHPDQFKTLEDRWGIKLTKDLACWPVFVELTERRNLFVHTDGVISSQYLSACKAHKCDVPENAKEGDQLWVPQGYMKAAQSCVFEIGVKLGQVLWRKIFPKDVEAADDNLTEITFELIDLGRFELAISILELATKVFKFSSESAKLTAIVNLAQSYKWGKRDKDCLAILGGVDWSAKGDAFKLADAVLREDWSAAQLLMRRIGKDDGLVTQASYRDWPLFQQLRSTDEFIATYKDVFGVDFQSARSISFEVNLAVENEGASTEAGKSLPESVRTD